jgi:hypothetical protein
MHIAREREKEKDNVRQREKDVFVKFDVKLLCWSCFWPFRVIGTFCFELSNQQYQKKKQNNSIKKC